MGVGLFQSFTLWIVLIGFLLYISSTYAILSYIGVSLLALYITDWTLKAIQNSMPRRTITDTRNKAVLITGKLIILVS